jgi:peroxiredoxin Q/BCP
MNLVSKSFPPFSLPDESGRVITELDLLGHWTVLYAYPKDSTPGCTQEACDFRDRMGRLQVEGAKVLGISKDSASSHKKFIANQGLAFPLLSDPEASLLQALGAYGTKIMYGKECRGIIRSTFLVDPQGVIRHAWSPVKVKGHADEVMAKLNALKSHGEAQS